MWIQQTWIERRIDMALVRLLQSTSSIERATNYCPLRILHILLENYERWRAILSFGTMQRKKKLK